jgi:phosphoglycerate kinase
LEEIAPSVSKQLGLPVAFCHECIGPEAQKAVDGLKDGEIVLLENVRFHAGEERNDPEFTAELAKLGDIFVNDAFSAAHRAHASIAGIAGMLPAYAGLGMEAELTALDKALGNPAHPVAALVGGAKISTSSAIWSPRLMCWC